MTDDGFPEATEENKDMFRKTLEDARERARIDSSPDLQCICGCPVVIARGEMGRPLTATCPNCLTIYSGRVLDVLATKMRLCELAMNRERYEQATLTFRVAEGDGHLYLIKQERLRQRAMWSEEHDDEHRMSDWQKIAGQYVVEAANADLFGQADLCRNKLVKAGAVIVAAIEALDRRG